MKNLYLAGVGNSLDDHWQRQWFLSDEQGLWLEHSSWEHIDRDTWVEELHAFLARTVEPVHVVAHSLGCLLLGEYVAQYGARPIAAALVVAVPDPSSEAFPASVTGFRSGYEISLALDCLVVASSNDPFASLDYTRKVAAAWDCRLLEVGQKGHINAQSGLGSWQEGRKLLARI